MSSLASDSGKEYYPIFFTMDFAFEEFFCICIQLLNKTWKEMRATSGDFNRVMQVVKDQICRALKEKHLSMELFRVCKATRCMQTSKDLMNRVPNSELQDTDQIRFFGCFLDVWPRQGT